MYIVIQDGSNDPTYAHISEASFVEVPDDWNEECENPINHSEAIKVDMPTNTTSHFYNAKHLCKLFGWTFHPITGERMEDE